MNNKQKILILAPHQDDELILCGSFLYSLIEQNYKIYIVYMTNGDYETDIGKVRLKEALKVMKKFGLPENQIIFMGYANEYDINGPHIYNADEGQIVKSQFGNYETYGLENHPEYCFEKYGVHHVYSRNNLIQDLFEILQEIKPDIIFSTDAEVHPDHKANSLFLDETLGKILQIEKSYHPIVLKKPEYSTSWFHPFDYSEYNNKASILYSKVKVNGETTDFYNPYIRWRDRTRLPVDLFAQNPIKKENSLWKALDQYKSQNAIIHYEQMLNSDVTFWVRRTNSLTYHSYIKTSSGNGGFLKDFKVYDSDDIKRRSLDAWEIGASVWHPEKTDIHPYIKIDWKEKKRISAVVIYQEFCPKSEILKSRIILEDGRVLAVGKLKKRKPTIVPMNAIFISGFTLIIDECSNSEEVPGISEIEVYEKKENSYAYIKLLVNDNFVYRYVVSENKRERLSIYLLDKLGIPHNINFDQVNISITDLYGQKLQTKDYINIWGILCSKLDQDIRLQISLKSQPQLYDVVLFFQDIEKERKFWRVVSLMKKIKIPSKDILDMENSIGFEKLNHIRKIYRIAKLKGEYELCMRLRLFYLHYHMECNRRNLLTDYQQVEGMAFLIFSECMPGSSLYIKKYFQGRRNVVVREKKRKVFLVGTPSHCNIGDHVIAFATKIYLKKILPDAPIIEISIQEFPYMLGILEKSVNKDDLFIMQGGGNMGNIYWTNERIRREVLKRFCDNPVIIFPETIYYENTIYGKTEMIESRRIYGKVKHLTICAREWESYKVMKKLYTQANIILTPDIVCSYRLQSPKKKNEIIRLFFRNDRECCLSDEIKNSVKKILDEIGEQYAFSDMLYQSKGYMGRSNRNYIVKDKIREISEAKLIITDRLHAMILSVLTGTPCIVFFGYNHKIESTYKTWFSKIPYVLLIKDIKELKCDMEKVINASKETNELPNWDNDFEPLNKVLREIWI